MTKDYLTLLTFCTNFRVPLRLMRPVQQEGDDVLDIHDEVNISSANLSAVGTHQR